MERSPCVLCHDERDLGANLERGDGIAQGPADLSHVTIAILRILGEHPPKNVLDLGRYLERVNHREIWPVRGRCLTGQQMIVDGTERVDIAAFIASTRVAGALVGSSITGRPEWGQCRPACHPALESAGS